jgi:hypothetical protein
MSEAQLMELFELDTQLQSQEQEDVYARLLETSIDVIGKKGRGKTLSAVAIGYQLRERFGRHVICVGSKMGLKEETFGPFDVMNEQDFRDEMERIDAAAGEEESVEKVAEAFEKYGISILYSTVIFDEAGKLFEARRAMDKYVQLTGYFMAQQRHYHVTTLFCAPDEKMIDKRIVQQVDWKGRCFHNKYTDTCRARFVQGLEILTLDIDGMDDSVHPAYYDCYDTHVMLGFRKASLKIDLGEKKKE